MKDNWLLHNVNDPKLPYGVTNSLGFKFIETDDYDGHAKSKKLKTGKDTGLRKSPSVANSASESEGTTKLGGKTNIKNTYINKINNLISDEKIAAKLDTDKS